MIIKKNPTSNEDIIQFIESVRKDIDKIEDFFEKLYIKYHITNYNTLNLPDLHSNILNSIIYGYIENEIDIEEKRLQGKLTLNTAEKEALYPEIKIFISSISKFIPFMDFENVISCDAIVKKILNTESKKKLDSEVKNFLLLFKDLTKRSINNKFIHNINLVLSQNYLITDINNKYRPAKKPSKLEYAITEALTKHLPKGFFNTQQLKDIDFIFSLFKNTQFINKFKEANINSTDYIFFIECFQKNNLELKKMLIEAKKSLPKQYIQDLSLIEKELMEEIIVNFKNNIQKSFQNFKAKEISFSDKEKNIIEMTLKYLPGDIFTDEMKKNPDFIKNILEDQYFVEDISISFYNTEFKEILLNSENIPKILYIIKNNKDLDPADLRYLNLLEELYLKDSENFKQTAFVVGGATASILTLLATCWYFTKNQKKQNEIINNIKKELENEKNKNNTLTAEDSHKEFQLKKKDEKVSELTKESEEQKKIISSLETVNISVKEENKKLIQKIEEISPTRKKQPRDSSVSSKNSGKSREASRRGYATPEKKPAIPEQYTAERNFEEEEKITVYEHKNLSFNDLTPQQKDIILEDKMIKNERGSNGLKPLNTDRRLIINNEECKAYEVKTNSDERIIVAKVNKSIYLISKTDHQGLNRDLKNIEFNKNFTAVKKEDLEYKKEVKNLEKKEKKISDFELEEKEINKKIEQPEKSPQSLN